MLEPAEAIRLLIVDDERVIADTLATIFTQASYETRAAYSAEEALALIEGWTPGLALIDVVLPGMNGIDLAIRLKAELPGLRLTLISGQAVTTGLLEHARRDGYDLDIVAKPVHPSTLLNLMASHRMN